MNRGTNSESRKLSRRRQQVHDLLMLAESDKRIAYKLQLSIHTVHDHIKELYRIAGVHTRSEYLISHLIESSELAEKRAETEYAAKQARIVRLASQLIAIESTRARLVRELEQEIRKGPSI